MRRCELGQNTSPNVLKRTPLILFVYNKKIYYTKDDFQIVASDTFFLSSRQLSYQITHKDVLTSPWQKIPQLQYKEVCQNVCKMQGKGKQTHSLAQSTSLFQLQRTANQLHSWDREVLDASSHVAVLITLRWQLRTTSEDSLYLSLRQSQDNLQLRYHYLKKNKF